MVFSDWLVGTFSLLTTELSWTSMALSHWELGGDHTAQQDFSSSTLAPELQSSNSHSWQRAACPSYDKDLGVLLSPQPCLFPCVLLATSGLSISAEEPNDAHGVAVSFLSSLIPPRKDS